MISEEEPEKGKLAYIENSLSAKRKNKQGVK